MKKLLALALAVVVLLCCFVGCSEATNTTVRGSTVWYAFRKKAIS